MQARRRDSMDNLVIHGEWIGKEAKVLSASNPSLVGIEGLVVDETKHLFVLRTDEGEKRVPKRLTRFLVDWNGRSLEVEGDELLASPEERVKRKVKR